MNLCLYWITFVFLLDLKFKFSMNHSLAHLYSQLYFHKQIINSNCAIKRRRGVSQSCTSAFIRVVPSFKLDRIFQRKPIGIYRRTSTDHIFTKSNIDQDTFILIKTYKMEFFHLKHTVGLQHRDGSSNLRIDRSFNCA